jgi:putative ABC transport system permease protein
VLRTTLRSLWAHKRRLLSTSVAVTLGVAFMAGTLVLSDTINRVFGDLFADAYEHIDVEVRGTALFESEVGPTHRTPLDEALTDELRAVDGVAGAQPWVMSMLVTLLDSDGDAAGGPTGAILESWVDHDEVDFGYRMAEGRPPEGDGEIALNVAAARDADHDLGDEVTVLTPEGRRTYELVGTYRWGQADSLAGMVAIQTTLAEAQRVANRPGQVDSVYVTGAEGIDPTDLAARLRPHLPPEAEALTGEEVADQEASDMEEAFGFVSQLLLVFAGIALFVGSFIIYNTFGILVAQRTRELALLRAVGAGRAQVLASVLVEAAVVGVIAAVAGIGLGLALGALAFAGLGAAGFDLPSAGLVLRSETAVAALVAGLVVTLVSAVGPAVRATRVPPLAAMRDVAVDRAGTSRIRLVLGLGLLAASVALAVPAIVTDSSDAMAPVGLGSVAGLVGLLVIGPIIARPLARGVGAWLPRVRGVTGTLARENAVRNPKRTASTSAALMIGVALVGFITVFAASFRDSMTAQVDRGFRADFVVQSTSTFSFTRVSPAMAAELADVEGVELVGSMRASEARLTMPDGRDVTTFVAAVDPATFDRVLDVRMHEGHLSDLGPRGLMVDRAAAEANGIGIGDGVEVTMPGAGTVELTVQALSDDVTTGDWTMALDAYEQVSPEQVDNLVGVVLAAGVDAGEVRPALEAVVDGYPGMTVQDRDDFVDSLAAQVSQLLNIVYGLLAISIVIAVIGIANTISLSVHERTRELGLLRAVGMTRGQLRSSIRWEAVLVAVLGTGLGLALGVAISFAVTQALSAQGLDAFTLPVGQLAVLVVLGGVVGTIAALRPAHRASRLDVLEAIATE